jgi:type I restriction enzyme M protein
MDMHSEEDVKFHIVPGILEELGYDKDLIAFNVTIEVKQGRKKRAIFADAVVFADEARTVPLVVVETKGPEEVITEGDVGQAVSYARLNTPIVPYVLVSNGHPESTKAYDTFTTKLMVRGLPKKDGVLTRLRKLDLSDEAHGVLVQQAKHQLFRVEDVQEYKRILRASHNIIRNNEGYDPTKAFDELSKVMFIKLYEEQRGGDTRFRASVFDDQLSRIGNNVLATIFEETKKDPRYAGLFSADEKVELEDRTMRELVRQFENYDLSLTGFDIKGEAFEHFLGDTFTGGLGQYFTPRNVVHFIVDALDPGVGAKIVDPFAGTGGFLIYAYQELEKKIAALALSDKERQKYLKGLSDSCLYGIDWNERTARACRMNMVIHGEGDSGRNIYRQSGFVDVPGVIADETFDYTITNPPFGASETEKAVLEAYEVSSGRNSIERAALALERSVRLAKPGGWVGIVIMDGILSNQSYQWVRDYVLRQAWVRALVSLPSETFEGYGGRADTTVLLLEKKAEPDEGEQDATFMAVCRNSGYAPNGAEIAGNELPAIHEAYSSWQAGKAFTFENAWEGTVGRRLDPKHYWRRDVEREQTPEAMLETGVGDARDHESALRDLQVRVTSLRRELPTVIHRVGDLVQELRTREKVVPGQTYRHVGVRWWGAGTFVREVKPAAEVKSATLQRITKGQLIYNRLFAFRGSFAIVNEECDGAFVSNEFPTYEAKPGVDFPSDLLLQYLVHALNSPQYLSVVDASSSGSTKTSRNRLRQDYFENLKISVPVAESDVRELVALMDAADSLRAEQERALGHAKALRESLTVFIPEP